MAQRRRVSEEERRAYRRAWKKRNRDKENASSRRWRSKNKAKVLAIQRRWYANAKARNPKHIRAQRHASYLRAKAAGTVKPTKRSAEQDRAYKLKYRAKDPGREKRYSKSYAARHPEKVRAKHKRYYIAHRDHLLSENKQWREANTARIRDRARARYATDPAPFLARERRVKSATPDDPIDRASRTAFIRSVRSADRISCYWCNKPVPKGKRHIDHIVPITKGGRNVVNNLCCSCARCNQSKNAKLPEEFHPQRLLPF